jgi:hypothetical protein
MLRGAEPLQGYAAGLLCAIGAAGGSRYFSRQRMLGARNHRKLPSHLADVYLCRSSSGNIMLRKYFSSSSEYRLSMLIAPPSYTHGCVLYYNKDKTRKERYRIDLRPYGLIGLKMPEIMRPIKPCHMALSVS